MAGELRHLRFPLSASRGRRYPEPEHPYRNAFQRDRDRIIHTRAFRRLENKTQVFTPGLSDHFRNRLTHTIEVAQISRTVAVVLGLDEDLTESLALAHDIGHPPFAHAGEEELDRRMRAFGERFDHNLHALRIVESFEQRYAAFPGLNLTFEVREGIVKHSRDLEPGADGDLAEYLPGLRPPLEAQLIDLADEIAYNTADLDDACGAGLVAADEIAARVECFARFLNPARRRYPHANERVVFHEALRTLFDWLVSSTIEGTCGKAASAGVADHEEVRRCSTRLASFTAEGAAAVKELKRFLQTRVYDSPALVEERRRSQTMIGRLFEYYLEDTARLPEPYRTQAASQPPHRVICDYIAGMTDPFFKRTYKTVFG